MALARVQDRTVFEDESAVDTLKALLAMHFVRARYTELIWADSMLRQAPEGHLAEILKMADDPAFLAACIAATRASTPQQRLSCSKLAAVC